jgi:predicted enzyme related to lactoylglutathione lyase
MVLLARGIFLTDVVVSCTGNHLRRNLIVIGKGAEKMVETKAQEKQAVRFECIEPILCVTNIAASLRFYVDLLGFENASWGNDDFTHVSRDGRGIYLCREGQGQPGAWVWIGVENVEMLHEQYKADGVKVRQPPTTYPWALEMQIEDPDGNVLRIGSEPK